MLNKFIKSCFRAIGLKVSRSQNGVLFSRANTVSAVKEADYFPSKFSSADIDQTLAIIKNKWPEKRILLLVDKSIDTTMWPYQSIVCSVDAIGIIKDVGVNEAIFLYACNDDDIGLPYIKEITMSGGLYYPVQIYTPSNYSHVDSVAKKVLQSQVLVQESQGFDKFDFGLGDALNITQAISITEKLSGDYLEIGCFRGSSACVALSYMREKSIARNCYFLDVFDGFSYEAAKSSSDAMWADTHETEGQKHVESRIVQHADKSRNLNAFVIKNNVVEEDLPNQIGNLVVANIDVDLYEAVLAGLVKVAPKIVHGGIIIVEDPGHTPALIGSRLALNEFFDLPISTKFLPIYLESGQTFLVKIEG